ncbi:hypothetical protein [Aestuariimicrobium ganziense]|uniref:hypothetical protein n=1 Tax=Aestuariimicrobium ganziense TaxID=2773677 RepID=UPI001942D8AB|nr:hypothetical protein [Aestuariimicrobium ganziense]
MKFQVLTCNGDSATADTAPGLTVTVTDLKKGDHGIWTAHVKACTTKDTSFGWSDISFADGAGKLNPAGNHEGDVLGDTALPNSTELAAGDCVEGDISMASADTGVMPLLIRGLLFRNEAAPAQLPKTGN